MNVNFSTWRKYASQIIDPETGFSLYKMHTPQWQMRYNWKEWWKTHIKPKWERPDPTPLEDVFAGKVTFKTRKHLLARLILEGYKKKECEVCGYDRGPIYSYKSTYYKQPLRTYALEHLDGNKTNNAFENLIVVCLNCRAEIFADKKRYKELITREDGTLHTPDEIRLLLEHRKTAYSIYDKNVPSKHVDEIVKKILEFEDNDKLI